MTYPNGITGTFGYDAESRVTNIVYGSFIDHTIHRNALGFKTTECIDAGLAPEPPVTLARNLNTHNAADQLTKTLRHEIGATNEFEFIHNDNGSLTCWEKEDPADTISYEYDYNNRLTSVQQGTDLTEYLLDASGARVGRVHNAVTNYFVVDQTDGLKRPLAETDASGTVTRYYVWAGSRLICHIDSDGTYRYYHSNELGSTIALTDASGTPTDQFAYMPYGYAKHTGTTETPFQWLGGYGVYYDADTQLHLTLYRAYSCDLKRFMQADPMGIDGGSNVYMMANLNPLWFIDPYGLCPESWGWLDTTQTVLDVAGMIPALGVIPDGVNTLISLGRGKWLDAGLNGLAMIPLLGQVATAGKWTKRGLKYGDEAAALLKHADDSVSLSRRAAFRNAKRANNIPVSQQPSSVIPNINRRGKAQAGRIYEFDTPDGKIRIRDDAGGHIYPDDPIQNRGPHFNDEAGVHYDYY